MLDRAAAGDPAGWFGTAADGRQPLAGLRPGRHLHDAPRHRPGAGPAPEVRPGGRRPPDLLRQLRQPGLRSRRTRGPGADRDPIDVRHRDREPRPDDRRRRDAAAAPPRCPAPADFRAEVAAYDRDAPRSATWDGPRYRMTYRVLGEGPPLILVPGIASTYRGYALMLNRLAERFRTIDLRLSRRARPTTAPGSAGSRHDDLVDDLFGLIDHLNSAASSCSGSRSARRSCSRPCTASRGGSPRRSCRGPSPAAGSRRPSGSALFLGRRIPGDDVAAPAPRDGPRRYNSRMRLPGDHRRPLDLLPRAERPDADRPLAHRLDLLARLDLRPILPEIPIGGPPAPGQRGPDRPAPLFRGAQGRACRRPRA